MEGYSVVTMSREEVDIAIDWAAKEGWNPGVADAEIFYQTDPTGFFAGKLNGEIIAVGSAIRYDEQFGFCGFYIVAPKYRGQGYGLELTKRRLAYMGERNVGIDGVLDMLEKYERLGYKIAHNNARYRKRGATPSWGSLCVVDLSKVDFQTVCDYDRRHFPAKREEFLKRWINSSEASSFGYLLDGVLKGYGVIRRCREGYKIGPLFADTPEIAEHLLSPLTKAASGNEYFLDIPEVNGFAKSIVKKYKFEKVFETARMYLKEDPKLPLKNIYGITTFELG